MDIFINGTGNTPSLAFNSEKKEWLIYGRSYNKDPKTCFTPILTWLANLENKSTVTYNFQFKLDFIDTGSHKVLLDVLLELKNCLANSGSVPSVQWLYEFGDEAMKDSGEILMTAADLHFELICYPEES